VYLRHATVNNKTLYIATCLFFCSQAAHAVGSKNVRIQLEFKTNLNYVENHLLVLNTDGVVSDGRKLDLTEIIRKEAQIETLLRPPKVNPRLCSAGTFTYQIKKYSRISRSPASKAVSGCMDDGDFGKLMAAIKSLNRP
jgi:hypothetical protein